MVDTPEGLWCSLTIGDESHTVQKRCNSTLEYRQRVAGKCLTQTTYMFSHVPDVLKIDRESLSGIDALFLSFQILYASVSIFCPKNDIIAIAIRV